MFGKISARRAKKQVYLHFSEPQPDFCDVVTKICSGERKIKFLCVKQVFFTRYFLYPKVWYVYPKAWDINFLPNKQDFCGVERNNSVVLSERFLLPYFALYCMIFILQNQKVSKNWTLFIEKRIFFIFSCNGACAND